MKKGQFIAKKAIILAVLAFTYSIGQSQEKSIFELEKPAEVNALTQESDDSDVLFVQEEKPQYRESGSLRFARLVQTHQYELIEQKLKEGFDPDTDLMLGNTMLHLAVMHKDLKMTVMALEYGAKIDSLNKNGETPIHWAAARGDMDILNSMLPLKNPEVYLNKKTKNGRSALHFCVLYSCGEEMLRYLLDSKADINAKDENKQSPLHYAAALGKTNEAMILLAKNANIADLDKNEESAEGYILTRFDMISKLKVLDYLSLKAQNDIKEANKNNSNIWRDVVIVE